MNIIDKVNAINVAKQNIKTAIENKGVVVGDDTLFENYGVKISEIPEGGSVSTDPIDNEISYYMTNFGDKSYPIQSYNYNVLFRYSNNIIFQNSTDYTDQLGNTFYNTNIIPYNDLYYFYSNNGYDVKDIYKKYDVNFNNIKDILLLNNEIDSMELTEMQSVNNLQYYDKNGNIGIIEAKNNKIYNYNTADYMYFSSPDGQFNDTVYFEVIPEIQWHYMTVRLNKYTKVYFIDVDLAGNLTFSDGSCDSNTLYTDTKYLFIKGYNETNKEIILKGYRASHISKMRGLIGIYPKINKLKFENRFGYYNYDNAKDNNVFDKFTELRYLPILSNIKITKYMFSNCKKLKEINAENILFDVNLERAFQVCSELETIGFPVDMSNVTYASGLFGTCAKLKEVNIVNTSKCLDMRMMFTDCKKLETINGIIDFKSMNASTGGSSTFKEYTFKNCISLKNVNFASNSLKYSMDAFYLVNLSQESFNSLLDCLGTTTGKTLSLSKKYATDSENLVKLTTEQISIANEKGWTISLVDYQF